MSGMIFVVLVICASLWTVLVATADDEFREEIRDKASAVFVATVGALLFVTGVGELTESIFGPQYRWFEGYEWAVGVPLALVIFGVRDWRSYDERAMAKLSKAVELNPTNPGVIGARGDAWLKRKQYDRAIRDYSRVIELLPDWTGAYYNRGRAHEESANYKEAISDYSKAIELDPKNIAPYYLLPSAAASSETAHWRAPTCTTPARTREPPNRMWPLECRLMLLA